MTASFLLLVQYHPHHRCLNWNLQDHLGGSAFFQPPSWSSLQVCRSTIIPSINIKHLQPQVQYVNINLILFIGIFIFAEIGIFMCLMYLDTCQLFLFCKYVPVSATQCCVWIKLKLKLKLKLYTYFHLGMFPPLRTLSVIAEATLWTSRGITRDKPRGSISSGSLGQPPFWPNVPGHEKEQDHVKQWYIDSLE